MGKPKLLLPWPDKRGLATTLIDKVLEAWTSSRVANVIVVVRRDDEPLRRACDRWPVTLVQPEHPPADMKASIQVGLRYLEHQVHPAPNDRCFIAPADLPTLTSQVVDRLIDTEPDDATIVVPQFGGQKGHPALLPWPMTSEIFDLAEDEGVNRIVDLHAKRCVPFSVSDAIDDIDTPEDYQRALQSAAGKRNHGPRK